VVAFYEKSRAPLNPGLLSFWGPPNLGQLP
jgi:hypothetical protein